MTTWVLVFWLMGGAGAFIGGNSTSGATTISGYKSQDSCKEAGRAARNLSATSGAIWKVSFSCIPGPKEG